MNIFDNELDLAYPNDEGFRLHIARTPAMRKLVYRLRYRAYTDAGVQLQRDDGIFPDKFDRCRNCVSHVLVQNGVAIGSIRANRCTSEDETSRRAGGICRRNCLSHRGGENIRGIQSVLATLFIRQQSGQAARR